MPDKKQPIKFQPSLDRNGNSSYSIIDEKGIDITNTARGISLMNAEKNKNLKSRQKINRENKNPYGVLDITGISNWEDAYLAGKDLSSMMFDKGVKFDKTAAFEDGLDIFSAVPLLTSKIKTGAKVYESASKQLTKQLLKKAPANISTNAGLDTTIETISRKKYGYGNTIENPNTAIYNSQIATARAKQKANSNSLTQGLDMFGNMATQIGGSMLTAGLGSGEFADAKGLMGFLGKNPSLIENGLNFTQMLNQRAMGGQIGLEDIVPKKATRRDSLNLQKNYLQKEKELARLGYKRQSSEQGSYMNSHGIMDKNYEEIKDKEAKGIRSQVIDPRGYRLPKVYPSSAYRENDIDGNPLLYKTQEAEHIGVLNPSVPYSLFDKRIAPTRKDLWVNEELGDGVMAYGYDFGEKYAPKKYKPSNRPITAIKPKVGNKIPVTRPADKMAMGGNVPQNIPVEVEGDEIMETPEGEVAEFEGASHEQGGIPVALPEGTEIYSKRIKIDGVSMADRKKKREKKTMTLESLFNKAKTDVLLRNALGRTEQNNETEELADTKIQGTIKQLLDSQEQGVEKYGDGTYPGGLRTKKTKGYSSPYMSSTNDRYATPIGMNLPQPKSAYMPVNNFTDNFGDSSRKFSIPAKNNNSISISDAELANADGYSNPENASSKKEEGEGFKLPDLLGGATFGDLLGMGGNYYQAQKIMDMTEANRAGDTPNINAFKDYGKDSLKTIDDSKQYAKQNRDQALQDIQLERNGAVRRNNNSSRSVNMSRALNLVTDATTNKANTDTYNQFTNQMMNILGQESNVKLQKDQAYMQGEDTRDDRDRQDRDSYYNNLMQAYKNKGQVFSEIGANFNKIKENKLKEKLANQMSSYGYELRNGVAYLPSGKESQYTAKELKQLHAQGKTVNDNDEVVPMKKTK